ncbi:MAG: Phosphoglucosamine mutase [candidate division TM6 bacterium GW2011_GWF2_32_72]|nr:MAG: Phosphoglucosamine mutase [candidate division TM6 bacterium GW2011_GWF2_32_72]
MKTTFKTNPFGTDGIRNKVGIGQLTVENIFKLGNAIAIWSKKNSNIPKILIAHDTRISCDFIKSTLCSSLLLHQLEIIDTGILTTPALAKIMQIDSSFNLGIMITASHNPYHDNGIKIFSNGGKRLTQEDEIAICMELETPSPNAYQIFGSLQSINKNQIYKDAVLQHFATKFLIGKKIILDCANGAASNLAPDIFTALGAELIIVSSQPTGTNINQNCGSTNIKKLEELVLKHNAECTVAFDGDGDRVCMLDKFGNEKDGDDILYVLSQHPNYKDQKIIVGTIMSNEGLAKKTSTENKTFIRAKVGDKNVAEKLTEVQSILGAEPSGHIIISEFMNVSDGIFAALKTLESLELTNNWNFASFKKYPQVLINLKVANKLPLDTPCIAEIIKKTEQNLISGRILIRYSGTENLLRVMVENSDLINTQNIATNLANELMQILGTI